MINLNKNSKRFSISNYAPELLLNEDIKNNLYGLKVTLILDTLLHNISQKIITCKFRIALSSKLGNKDTLIAELNYIIDTLLPICYNTLETIKYSNERKSLLNKFELICKDLLIHFPNSNKIKEFLLKLESKKEFPKS